MNLLPKESNFATLKLFRVAREDLSFNDIENKKLEIVQDGNQVKWNMEAAKEVDKHAADIKLGEVVTALIVEELKKLDDNKGLTEEPFSLYEKFILEKE